MIPSKDSESTHVNWRKNNLVANLRRNFFWHYCLYHCKGEHAQINVHNTMLFYFIHTLPISFPIKCKLSNAEWVNIIIRHNNILYFRLCISLFASSQHAVLNWWVCAFHQWQLNIIANCFICNSPSYLFILQTNQLYKNPQKKWM